MAKSTATKSTSRSKRQPQVGRVVALTGVGSFVGRHLLTLLERDPAYSKIIAFDIDMPHVTTTKTTFYRTDLTQPTIDATMAEVLKREQVDTFVHLAFLQTPSHNAAHAHELENIGTMYVINACAEAKVHKFILWSSTLVYGAEPLNPNYLGENHPLVARRKPRFIRDKIEAELQVRRFRQDHPDRVVTVLRPCTVIGPTFDSFATRFLSRRLVPNLMGYDPLVQFLHEDDLISAFKLALDRDVSGEFNLVGDGVLALSTVFRLTGAIDFPLPHFVAFAGMKVAWAMQLVEAPPGLLSLLRYLLVADGDRAKRELGFVPQYSSKETLLDFVETLRLRRIQAPAERAIHASLSL